MRKSFLLFLSLVFIFASLPSFAMAATIKYTYYFQGTKIDAAPVEKNGIHYLDAKVFAAAAGYAFSYDGAKKHYVLQQDKNVKITFKANDKNYFVNGSKKSVTAAAALSVGGKTVLSVNFIAKMSSKKITTYDDEKIANFGDYSPVDPGSVKGLITWQYNEYIGTKPDVGAKIYLIPLSNKKEAFTYDVLMGIPKIGDKDTGVFYSGKANGNGNYEIANVPSGEYIILVISAKTTRDFSEEYNDKYGIALLKPYFKYWNEFSKSALKFNNSEVSTITVNNNQSIDFSHDFGYTYI